MYRPIKSRLCFVLIFLVWLPKLFGNPDPYMAATHAKGGTGLLNKALNLIHGEKRPIHLFELVNPHHSPEKMEEVWAQGEIPGTHLYSPFFTRNYFHKNHPDFKILIIIRDIRDAYVSFAHWIYGDRQDLSEQDKIDLVFQNGAYFTMCSHLSLFLDDPRFYVVRFEELIGPKGGGDQEKQIAAIYDLAAYIGMPISLSEAAEYGDALFGGGKTFRKGQIGSWKEACSEEQKAWLKHHFADELIRLGYEKDYAW